MERATLVKQLAYFDADVVAAERRIRDQRTAIAELSDKGLRTYEAWTELHALEAAFGALIS